MKMAAIAKLKATLSECIDYVKSGEEILVTDRGKPVARITPVGGGLAGDVRRTQLVCRGIIRPGKGCVSGDLLKNIPSVHVSQDEIARIIGEERDDRI
ncbi:MAG: type II toxin-antitoxin system Phd/YefM family antitoxin [Armatimonadota bacterium]